MPGQPAAQAGGKLLSNCSNLPVRWWDSSEVYPSFSESPSGSELDCVPAVSFFFTLTSASWEHF